MSLPIFMQVYLVAVTAVAVIALFYFLGRNRKIKEFNKSLELVLYEVTLPYEKKEDDNKEKKDKDLAAAMEQMYNGLVGLKTHFILEIGVSVSGNELVFYAAIERKHASLFEKQAHAFFPHASIVFKKDDYNIFKPQGFSSGAVARLEKEAVLPLRTYKEFEVDPLQALINVFSKLQKEGEGAALQMVAWPSKDKIAKKAKKAAGEVRKGKSLSKALEGDESIAFMFFKEFWNLFFGSSDFFRIGEDKSAEKKPEDMKPMDEELAKNLELKASRECMKTDIRLIVSSDTQERSDVILTELESAFLQFNTTQGNSLKFTRMTGKRLQDLFYKFSFRIPDKNTAINLNTIELATIFHFPLGIGAAAASQVKYLKTKEAPPPLNLPNASEGVLLGKNHYRGEVTDVYMKQEDRRRHFYIIGQTGTGKSVVLKNLILQDILAGRGVCYIDPHGSDLQDILACIPPERADDVIYFNPGDTSRPMGLNMMEYDPNYPEQKTFIANEIYSIFRKIWKDLPEAFGPMFEQYYRNAVLLVMDSPELGNTFVEIIRVLSDEEFRDKKMAACKNPLVVSFWRDIASKAGGEAALSNIVPYISSKFDVFLGNEIMRPIIAQEKSAINFRDVMDNQKILLVNLSKGRLGDINSYLLGLIIVGKILMAALSRVDTPESERKDFYLYIDEFQNVTTDSIATILSEARKYKLDLTMAHQFIGQLEENIKKAVFGNVGSMAVFRVGSEDGEFLQKQFEPVFNSYDLLNIDNYNACVKLLIGGQVSRPFNLRTLPFPKGDPRMIADIAHLSSLKYGRPKPEVEAEIRAKYEAFSG